MDRTNHEDDGDHQQDQPGEFLLLVVEPAALVVVGPETDGQHLVVHPVHRLLDGAVGQLVGTDEIKAHRDRVGLVLLADGQARAVLGDAPRLGELHLVVGIHRHGGIVDVPEIQLVLGRGNEAHADIFPVVREGAQGRIVERRLEGGVVGVGTDAPGAERLEIIAQVELRPGSVGVIHSPNLGLGDAAVGPQVLDQPLGVVGELIVVVAREVDGVGLGVRADVVVEIAVVDARDGPVGPAEVGGYRDDVALDARGQPGALVFGFEPDRDGAVVVGRDACFENVDLVEVGEVVLHTAHHLVELLDRAALGHAGADGELRTGRLAVEVGVVHGLVEKAEGGAEDLVHRALVVGIGLPAHDLVEHDLVGLERSAVLVAELAGQQAGGDAEQGDEQHPVDPAVAQAPADVAAVGGAAPRQAAQPARPARRRPRRLHRKVFQQRRHEEVGHQQRHAEVDHDHPGEVRQVGPLLLGHQQDDEQRRDRGHHGAEQRGEDPAVAAAGIVVDHHDAVVDDDAQRHRHAGEGVDVDLEPQEIVERDRDQQVDRQGHGDHQHIAPRARHHEHEHQQDQQAERRAEINPVQFVRDVFRVVVGHGDADFLREAPLEFGDAVFDILHHAEQVGVGAHLHRQGQHVEAVDAVVGVRQGFLVAEGGEIAQVNHAPVHPRHGDLRHPGLLGAGVCPRAAQAHAVGLPAALRHSDDLLGIVVRERAADLVRGDPGGSRLVGVEGDHPLERRLAVETHAAHPVHDGERIEEFPLHEIRDLLRRQGAADVVGDGRLGLLAAGIERDGRVGTAVREFRIEVADLRGHFEADGLDVGAARGADGHGPAAVARDAAGGLHGADRGEHALQLGGHLRLHDARGGAGIAVTDRDVARGRRGGILYLEPREAGDAHHGRHRHQQQHREGGYAPPLRHQPRRRL